MNILIKGGIRLKQLIVLIASLILGIALFNLIAGPGDDSIYSSVRKVWQTEVEIKTLHGVE